MGKLVHSSVRWQADVCKTDAMGRTPLYCAALEGEAALEWVSHERKNGMAVVATFAPDAPSQAKHLRFAR